MRKVKTEETNMSGKQVLGGLLVGFAVIDFAASWGAGVNLTPFFGPLSAFSPMVFGFIGMAVPPKGAKTIFDSLKRYYYSRQS